MTTSSHLATIAFDVVRKLKSVQIARCQIIVQILVSAKTGEFIIYNVGRCLPHSRARNRKYHNSRKELNVSTFVKLFGTGFKSKKVALIICLACSQCPKPETAKVLLTRTTKIRSKHQQEQNQHDSFDSQIRLDSIYIEYTNENRLLL